MNSSVVMALNCGSSSLKFGLYRERSEQPPELLIEGEAEEIGHGSTFWMQLPGGVRQEQRVELRDHEAAYVQMSRALQGTNVAPAKAIGHRFVHGGPRVRQHSVWTPQIGEDLQHAVEFAPLHVPAALGILRAAQDAHPSLPQIICLDTAFHRDLPEVSKTLPLPADIRAQGVERYGFHGLSLESIWGQLSEAPSRLVVAHLGNGCSVTAIRDGQSQATTMALTPNAGMLMGTRTGDIDAGVVTWLIRHRGVDADQLDELLSRKSGLLGVSNISSDVRTLMSVRHEKPSADLALRMFALAAAQQIAAMGCALGGIDLLVFTGGIGEHASELRGEITEYLKWLPPFDIRVLPSQEDLQIAAVTLRLAGQPAP